MKKKVISMIIVSIVLCITFVFQNTLVVEAINSAEITSNFKGESSNATSGQGIINKVVGPVLSVVRIIASGVAVTMITYLGIKYMSAAPNEKADIKNQLIAFTVGAVFVIGATSILDIIKGFSSIFA